MRYRGGGIGHKVTWHLNDRLLQDRARASDLVPSGVVDEEIPATRREEGNNDNIGGNEDEDDDGEDDGADDADDNEDDADDDGADSTDDDSDDA